MRLVKMTAITFSVNEVVDPVAANEHIAELTESAMNFHNAVNGIEQSA